MRISPFVTVFSCFVTILSVSPVYAGSALVLDDIQVKATMFPLLSQEVRSEDAEESSVKDVSEALQHEPAVSTVRRGGFNGDIVLRGFRKDDVNVVVDGGRLYGAGPSRMDPPSSLVDLSEVERIEVKRGAFDVTQAGGIGGSINLITKEPAEGFHGKLKGSLGSFSAGDVTGGLSYGGDVISFLAGGGKQSGNVFKDGHGQRFTDIYSSASMLRYKSDQRQRRAYEKSNGWGKLLLTPASGHHLALSYSRNEAGVVLYPYLKMDSFRDDVDRFHIGYSLSGLTGGVSKISARFYNSRIIHDMDNSLRCMSTLNPMMCSGAIGRSYSMRSSGYVGVSGGNIEAEFSRWGKTLVGIDAYSRKWRFDTTMRMGTGMYMTQASIPDVDSRDAGVYIEHHHQINNKLHAVAGVRFDSAETLAHVDRSSVYTPYFGAVSSQKRDSLFGGNLQLFYTLNEDVRFFAGFGHSERLPDAQERYFALTTAGTAANPDRISNPSLKPVKNNEFDLGVDISFQNAVLKASVFYSDVQDYIEAASFTSSAGRIGKGFQNIHARLIGGEVSLSASLPWDIFLDTSLSYTQGDNRTGHTALSEMPPLKGSLSLRHDTGTYFIEVAEDMAATQSRVSSLLSEAKTPGYGVTRLKAGYNRNGFSLIAGVENLFDHYYVDHLSYQRDPFASGVRVAEPGRTAYVNLTYAF